VRTFAFVVYDGFQTLDLAGPLEVLRTATLLGASPGYRVVIASPDGQPVRSESGLTIAVDTSLAALRRSRSRLDALTVVGGEGSRPLLDDKAALAALRAIAGRAERVVSVCTGAIVLAGAGLLDGYQATTHWAWCEYLGSHWPAVEIEADRIYVHDRDRWTSAGVTAGIDLFLALVEADHGPELAHQIAGWLVVFVRRPGGQAQFSAQLLAQPANDRGIDEVQRWAPDHLDDDLSVEALARRANMSPRTFARAFRSEAGTTPAAYVEGLRVEAARRLLETTSLGVGDVAVRVGLKRAETLHRAFRRRVGTTPEQYRQHFGLRAS
jgi:transcriptional regulator GlxA family with amidase domain